MKKHLFIFIGFVLTAALAEAQSVDMYLGNKAMEIGDLDKAETLYNKALEKQSNLFEGHYNLGNVAYKKGDYETATNQFQQAASLAQNNEQRAKAYHNLGNSQLQTKKYEESIKSYKESLKLNPQDNETRYNLAYAQKMLKQQQHNQDQDKDQDKQDQENKDQEKQEQKDQDKNSENKDNKEKQEQEDSEKKESENGKDNKQEDGEKKQPKPVNLSPREAEQLLEAAKEQDQKLQMQLHKQEKKANPKTIDKDW